MISDERTSLWYLADDDCPIPKTHKSQYNSYIGALIKLQAANREVIGLYSGRLPNIKHTYIIYNVAFVDNKDPLNGWLRGVALDVVNTTDGTTDKIMFSSPFAVKNKKNLPPWGYFLRLINTNIIEVSCTTN